METLENFNKKRRELHQSRYMAKPNGIECPECKSELYDTNPAVTLMSHPPKKDVHCEKCGFIGYRVE